MKTANSATAPTERNAHNPKLPKTSSLPKSKPARCIIRTSDPASAAGSFLACDRYDSEEQGAVAISSQFAERNKMQPGGARPGPTARRVPDVTATSISAGEDMADVE